MGYCVQKCIPLAGTAEEKTNTRIFFLQKMNKLGNVCLNFHADKHTHGDYYVHSKMQSSVKMTQNKPFQIIIENQIDPSTLFIWRAAVLPPNSSEGDELGGNYGSIYLFKTFPCHFSRQRFPMQFMWVRD